MKGVLSILFFCFFYSSATAQKSDITSNPKDIKDKIEIVDPESGKANYMDYKVISHYNDTTIIDTTLTLQKYYKMNYLRKDLFGLHPFQNQGQVFNPLKYSFDNSSIFPSMGASAKHINYYEIEDIKYYRVPTPTTEFLYRTGLEQGQVLDSKLALNINNNLNFSLSYKGLRSLGKYRNSLSSHTNFRGTLSYLSKNKRYSIKTHIANQNLENQENGGLTKIAISFFKSNNPDYLNRGNLNVNLENARSWLVGKRYYFEHNYKLFKEINDKNKKVLNLKLGHIFNYETKRFYFFETNNTNLFGPSFENTTNDKTSNKTMSNKVYLDFKTPYLLGNFRILGNYYYYFYGYKNIIYKSNSEIIPNQLKGNVFSMAAKWKTSLKNIYFYANAETSIYGDLTGNNISIKANYKKENNTKIGISLQINSKAPNFNFVLFQSNFSNYNWLNELKNIHTKNLNFKINSKWGTIDATATQIKNYTYFRNYTQSLPIQYEGNVNYLKIKANNEIKFWKFTLNSTILYQKVARGESVLKVPDFISRNTFYFSEVLFKKKSLYLQTGITANYFSSYKSNIYNPILGEFVLQKNSYIGGKTIIDIFINGQVRRTKIYFKAENILSRISKKNYYVTPNQPYRDFVIRFGVVWNFFK